MVIVLFEESGKVRDAFIDAGYPAMSVDILPSRGKYRDKHWQGDVWKFLSLKLVGIDALIMHPPCTYLCVSGNRHHAGTVRRENALKDVAVLLGLPVKFKALENPVGVISTNIKPATQYIQPWMFGHPESKKTGLWLDNLPPLQATNILQRPKSGRWENQTPSGQNKLGPGPLRERQRSETYQGIADAMAAQWGPVIFGK